MRERVLPALVAVVAVAGSAVAQETETRQPPEIAVSTSVVALQVVVTDGRGAGIGDLTREDFEVREDGKSRPIVAFEAIDASVPPALRAGRSPALAAVSRRQYVLLFDLSFSEPRGLVKARDAAIEFVDGLPAGDLVAVGTISVDSGARLLVNLTGDRRQVRSAVDSLGLGAFQRRPDPLRLALDLGADTVLSRERLTGAAGPPPPPEEGEGGPGRGQLEEWVRDSLIRYRHSEQEQYARQVTAYLESLQNFGQALDWVSGRKEVILLSSGFDPTPIMGADTQQQRESAEAVTFGRLWEVDSDAYFGSVEARGGLFDMVKDFAGSNSVIHTVDVSGLVAGGSANELAGESRPGAGREALAAIANASGGAFVHNTNDIAGALCQLAETTRRFYAMAFEPSPGGKPGQFRRIEVKVARRGTRVSYRSGYKVPDPADDANPLARQLRAAEAIAKGLSGGDFDVRGLALPHRDAGGRISLPLTIEVDSRSIFEGAGPLAEVEVYGYALGPNGGVQDALVFRGTVDSRAIVDEEEPLQVKTSFEVEPGIHQIRIVVREAQTGHTGTRSLDLVVPDFGGETPLLYPPLVMRTLDEANGVEAPSMRIQKVRQPFQVAGREFGISLAPSLSRERSQRVCVMYWPGNASFDPEGALELGVELLGPEGPLPMAVELAQMSEEADGFRRYVLAATPGDVPDGDYTLEARVVDPTTGRESVSRQRVRVTE